MATERTRSPLARWLVNAGITRDIRRAKRLLIILIIVSFAGAAAFLAETLLQTGMISLGR